jgi:hypothetical protein
MLFWTQGINSQTPCVSVAGGLEGLGGIGQLQIQETLFHTMVPEKDSCQQWITNPQMPIEYD